MEERVQKILARSGFGSRRFCETLITAGRVRVNGIQAQLGSKADADVDQILVDNHPIPQPEAKLYIALNKPRGVLSTVEAPDSRSTVRDLVSLPGTIYPVGRLDVDSEGLILLTNDGDLADHLTHPKYQHAKEYRVLVARQPDNEQLEAFRHGVVLSDGYRTAPAEVHIDTQQGKGAWLGVTLYEGRKRQIRETCAQIGLPVVRIVRIRIATLKLGSLKPGQWRKLTTAEIAALKSKPDKPAGKPLKPGKPFDRQTGQQIKKPKIITTRKPTARTAPDYPRKPVKPYTRRVAIGQSQPPDRKKKPRRRTG